MSLELEDVKAHLRIQHDVEDTLILTYWDAAIGHVEQYLGDNMPDPAPRPIDAAILLLVADMYEHRTRQTTQPLSEGSTFRLLLNPYRSMSVCA